MQYTKCLCYDNPTEFTIVNLVVDKFPAPVYHYEVNDCRMKWTKRIMKLSV